MVAIEILVEVGGEGVWEIRQEDVVMVEFHVMVAVVYGIEMA